MIQIQHNSTHCDHIEYTWVLRSLKEWQQRENREKETAQTRQCLREMLNQITFQCVRGNNDVINQWRIWLTCIQDIESFKKFLSYGVATCAWVRDMTYGKGERKLAYEMLWALYDCLKYSYPDEAERIVYFMIRKWCHVSVFEKPYGSWRDLKEFCHLVWYKTENRRHPLITGLFEWMIILKEMPLVHKWMPRERTSPVYDTFVEEWLRNNDYEERRDMRILKPCQRAKCRKIVRKDLQKLRQRIKTPYIVQPRNIGIHKQFCLPGDIVHRVRLYWQYPLSLMKWNEWNENKFKTTMNHLWREMRENIDVHRDILFKKVPCIDISQHMSEEQLENAIGLGLWIAQSSGRLLIVGDKPLLIDVQEDFCIYDEVIRIYNLIQPIRGMHFNIYEALHKYKFMGGYQLVILSAFQCSFDETILFDKIKKVKCLYDNLYEMIPGQELIFWNLAPSNGFPVASTHAKCVMVSGYSPTELKIPSMVWGVQLDKIYTSYSHLLLRLNSYRYLSFVNFVLKLFGE